MKVRATLVPFLKLAGSSIDLQICIYLIFIYDIKFLRRKNWVQIKVIKKALIKTSYVDKKKLVIISKRNLKFKTGVSNPITSTTIVN